MQIFGVLGCKTCTNAYKTASKAIFWQNFKIFKILLVFLLQMFKLNDTVTSNQHLVYAT
jgi:hypothetical protein